MVFVVVGGGGGGGVFWCFLMLEYMIHIYMFLSSNDFSMILV